MQKPLVYLASIGAIAGSAFYAFYPKKDEKNIPVTKNYVPSDETINKIKNGRYKRYDDPGFVPFARVKDNLNASKNLKQWSEDQGHQFTGDAFIYALDSWFWGMDMRSFGYVIDDFEDEIKSFISDGGMIDRLLIEKGSFLPPELKS